MTDLLPAVREAAPPAPRIRPPLHARVVAYSAQFVDPPDVRFEAVRGLWCPMCRGVLGGGPGGWLCPACMAEWDFRGLHGRWIVAGGPAAWGPALAGRRRLVELLLAALRRVPRIPCCGWIRPAAGLLGAALVPVQAVAAQSLLDARLVGFAEPGPWCWLLPTACSPAVVALAALVLGRWHRLRRHRSTVVAAVEVAGGAR